MTDEEKQMELGRRLLSQAKVMCRLSKLRGLLLVGEPMDGGPILASTWKTDADAGALGKIVPMVRQAIEDRFGRPVTRLAWKDDDEIHPVPTERDLLLAVYNAAKANYGWAQNDLQEAVDAYDKWRNANEESVGGIAAQGAESQGAQSKEGQGGEGVKVDQVDGDD